MPRSKEVASPSRFLNILSNKPKAAKHNKIKIIGFMHSFYNNNEKKSKKFEYIKLDRDKSTFKSHRDFNSEKEISFKHF